jgi:hypothetical protein
MKCPHCKKADLEKSQYHPITFGCPECLNVFSEPYMQGYCHGLRDVASQQVDTPDQISQCNCGTKAFRDSTGGCPVHNINEFGR